jgi:hypothetical protein
MAHADDKIDTQKRQEITDYGSSLKLSMQEHGYEDKSNQVMPQPVDYLNTRKIYVPGGRE